MLKNKFISVYCGVLYTIALDENGNIWVCGDNKYGQLGLGNNDERYIFTKIISSEKFKNISCGIGYTVALDFHDNIWSCGTNGALLVKDDVANILIKFNSEYKFEKNIRWLS